MSKKGATQSGSTAGRKRAKDQAMAADLAKRGVKRTTHRCPVTNKIVPLGKLGLHTQKD